MSHATSRHKPHTLRLALPAALVWLAWAPGASATLADAIAALSPGDEYRVIFVTQNFTTAESTVISDYDSFVGTAASAGSVTGPLGLTWQALASTAAESASAHTGTAPSNTDTVYFFNTQGDTLAVSVSDLWDGALLFATVYDENGQATTSNIVWSGTGAYGGAVSGKELGQTAVAIGDPTAKDYQWIEGNSTVLATNTYPLYGISSLGVVSIPEPATLALFGLGLAGIPFVRRRRTPA